MTSASPLKSLESHSPARPVPKPVAPLPKDWWGLDLLRAAGRPPDKLLLPLQAGGGEGGQGPAHGCGFRAARRGEDGDGLQRSRRTRTRAGGWRFSRLLSFIRLHALTRRYSRGFYFFGGSGAGLSAADQSESGTASGDGGGGARSSTGRGARNLPQAGRTRLPSPPGCTGVRKEKRRGSHTAREAPTRFSRKKTVRL